MYRTGCSDVHIFSHVVRDAAFQRIPDVPADADPMAKWPHKTPQFARVGQYNPNAYWSALGTNERVAEQGKDTSSTQSADHAFAI